MPRAEGSCGEVPVSRNSTCKGPETGVCQAGSGASRPQQDSAMGEGEGLQVLDYQRTEESHNELSQVQTE